MTDDSPFASEPAEKAYQSLLRAGGNATRDDFRLALQTFVTAKGDYDSLLTAAFQKLGGKVTLEQLSAAMQTFVTEDDLSERAYERFRRDKCAKIVMGREREGPAT